MINGNGLTKQKFEDGMSDDVVRELVLPLKNEVIEFISNATYRVAT